MPKGRGVKPKTLPFKYIHKLKPVSVKQAFITQLQVRDNGQGHEE
jgi:hypothetical protein